VRSMLGSIERGHVYDIVRALAAQDGPGLLAQVAALAEQAPDFSSVLAELLSLLQRIAVAQTVPDALDDSYGDRDTVQALAQALSPEDVQLFYQIGLIGRRDLNYAPDPRGGLEMVLLRMLAFRPDTATTASPGPATPARARTTAEVSTGARPAAAKPAVQGAAEAVAAVGGAEPPVPDQVSAQAPEPAPVPAPTQAAVPTGDWPALIEAGGRARHRRGRQYPQSGRGLRRPSAARHGAPAGLNTPITARDRRRAQGGTFAAIGRSDRV
ncbi:MAG: hypothetical protein ABR565_09260, partial [Gammaproteobacteria bacterium]